MIEAVNRRHRRKGKGSCAKRASGAFHRGQFGVTRLSDRHYEMFPGVFGVGAKLESKLEAEMLKILIADPFHFTLREAGASSWNRVDKDYIRTTVGLIHVGYCFDVKHRETIERKLAELKVLKKKYLDEEFAITSYMTSICGGK